LNLFGYNGLSYEQILERIYKTHSFERVINWLEDNRHDADIYDHKETYIKIIIFFSINIISYRKLFIK